MIEISWVSQPSLRNTIAHSKPDSPRSGVVWGGATPIPKKWMNFPVPKGAHRFTNVWSIAGLKWQIRMPLRLLGTTNLLRFIGRANVITGWALVGYDAISIGICTNKCVKKYEQPCENC